MGNKVLIVVPAYNEQDNIEKVIDRIHLVSSEFHVIIVNDGSSDNTAKIAKSKGVIVLSHPVNLGAGATIQTGLKYAVLNGFDLAVVVDGDGQHNPDEIPELLKALKNNQADIVVGSRFLTKEYKQVPWARRIGIILFSIIASAISRSKITDTTSGFRLFNKKAIDFLAKDMPGDFPDADMLLLLILSGFNIVEVPVEIRERVNGQSMYSLLRSTYYPFKLTVAILAVLLRMLFKGGA